MGDRRLCIAVDYDKCVGSKICVLTASKVFALNEDRQSYVIDPRGDTLDQILAAAEGCPMMAITVRDADTGEQLFPPPSLLAKMDRREG